MKTKKPRKSTLKKKAWKAFARFIKARDANKDGIVICCTCNAVLRYNEPNCQAGHFIGGRGNAVLFDEIGVHGQCARCNHYGSGEQFLYGLFMKRKYHLQDAELETMRINAKKPVKIKEHELCIIEEEYNNKADALIAMKGI